MSNLIKQVEDNYKKNKIVDVKTGDTVRVHQKIKEGNKERIQIFEGLVIKKSKKNSLTSTIIVRRISSGIGVEKSFVLHSPNITKIEVTKRSKVRRNYLSYIRKLTGKATRLSGVDFDKNSVNDVRDLESEKAEKELAAAKEKEHQEELAMKKKLEQEEAKKFEEATASRNQ